MSIKKNSSKGIHIIIQARTKSVRFPNKISKYIENKMVIDHVLERLNKCTSIDDIIIATTIEKEDDGIEQYCKKNDITYFRGDEKNVLERYYQTAKCYDSRHIVRITSDCPLIDPTIIDEFVLQYKKQNLTFYDMVYSNAIPGAKGGFPDGFNATIFSFEELEEAYNNAYHNYDIEHVCPYIYRKYTNNVKYHIPLYNKHSNIDFKTLHLSLDTKQDYELLINIFEHLHTNFSIYDVLDYINQNYGLLDYQIE